MVQEPLAISLAGTMLESGASSSFSVGQELAFALEFLMPAPLQAVKGGRRSLTHIGGARYSAIGRSVCSERHWWVVDFGIPAYARVWPEAPKHEPGTVFEGQVHLAMDPGDYCWDFSLYPSAPPLVFDWRIVRIEAVAKTGVAREFSKVPAFADDEECIIHCVRLAEEPRRSSACPALC